MARTAVEPEPELDTAICVSVPILLELEGLGVQSPSRCYVVWKLEDSPQGDCTYAGIHAGYPSWEGIQSLLASGTYVRGRDRLRRVDAPAGGDALQAARLLYREEAQVHGAPARPRVWFWPVACEAELVRRVHERRFVSGCIIARLIAPSKQSI
eukprot:4511081-Amphidinium_carterae.1